MFVAKKKMKLFPCTHGESGGVIIDAACCSAARETAPCAALSKMLILDFFTGRESVFLEKMLILDFFTGKEIVFVQRKKLQVISFLNCVAHRCLESCLTQQLDGGTLKLLHFRIVQGSAACCVQMRGAGAVLQQHLDDFCGRGGPGVLIVHLSNNNNDSFFFFPSKYLIALIC